jgi:hypothetical protein
MKRQLYMGGGIMNARPRQKFLLGGVGDTIKDLGKKAVSGIKDIVSSDVGKAALLAAGVYKLGGGQFGSLLSGGPTGFEFTNLPGASLFTGAATGADATKPFLSTKLGKFTALGGLSAFLTTQFGMTEEQQAEVLKDPENLKNYLRLYYKNLNQDAKTKEVEEFVETNTAEYTAGMGAYAEGGRIGFADGPVLPPDPTQPVNPFAPKPPADAPVLPDRMASNMENDKILEALFEKYIDLGFSPKEAADKAREEFDRMSMGKTEGRGLAAIGGKMDSASDNAMQAAGIEGLPVRQNPKGVKELDLRETGGFIQPVGIKEKEDDIPAMLSNNEFVFTADAVRGMGDGNVNVGAQRMYDMMKKLEAGGRV